MEKWIQFVIKKNLYYSCCFSAGIKELASNIRHLIEETEELKDVLSRSKHLKRTANHKRWYFYVNLILLLLIKGQKKSKKMKKQSENWRKKKKI